MRLSNIEIKDMYYNYTRSIVRKAKCLVLNIDDGQSINIVLGIRGRDSQRGSFIDVPITSLFQSHIAISYDFLLRDFYLIKNRSHTCGVKFNSINEINELLSQQFLNMGFSVLEKNYIITKICECITLTTDEPIFFTRNFIFGATQRDLYVNGHNGDIIRKNIDVFTPSPSLAKHNFLN